MGKMISHARRLRLLYAAQQGQLISIRQVAEAIGVDRRLVMRIENHDFSGSFDTVRKLADFYTNAGLDARQIVEYVPDEALTE